MTAAATTARTATQGAPAPCAVFRNRFEIDPGIPLETFSTPAARAYAASDRASAARRLFALVCSPTLPVRLNVLGELRSTPVPGLLSIAEAGVVDWPIERRRALVIIYQRPLGESLAAAFAPDRDPIPPHEIGTRVVAPMVRALRGLEKIEVPHRAIHPGNVFFMDAAGDELVLGDCISAPPGYNQPAAMETIERAMASPCGRGEGSTAEDMYALGVTIAWCALGRSASDAVDERKLLEGKITKGSFNALCERQPIAPAVTELLRGLLHDDAERRWGLDEVERWLAGDRRQQSRGPQRPSPPPLTFAGRPYTSLRLLAMAMTEHVGEAAKLIRSGDLGTWLAKRANAREQARAVEREVIANDMESGRPAGAHDYLVARVVRILDPDAPVRYVAFRFMPDGFGPALAEMCFDKHDTKTPSSAIALGLADAPGSASGGERKRGPQISGQLRRHLETPGYGGGLERCLYATNPGLACQSPLVANAHAISVDGLIAALEDSAPDLGRRIPMDRQMAAFIAARWAGDLGPLLKSLNNERGEQAVLPVLSLLTTLHNGLDVGPLPRLAMWFAAHLDSAVDLYRSRSLRRDIRRQLPRIAKKGRLKDVLALIDDVRRQALDRRGAKAAAAEYAAIEATVRELSEGGQRRRKRCTELGHRIASAISLSAGLAVGCATLLSRIM